MAFGDISDAAAVHEAIEEYDRLGETAFLEKYGYGAAQKYLLVVDGKAYDSKAILGVAHGYQFREKGPLDSGEFSGGAATVVPKLEKLGFTVRERGTHQLGRGVQYWALCANPKVYDIERAVQELTRDWWGIGNHDLRPGDGVLIWRTKAGGEHRGVVAFGEVAGEAEQRTDPDNPFWRDTERAGKEQTRVPIRYEVPEGLPIWMDGPRGDVIEDLTVARGRGGTVFHVEPAEWAEIRRVARRDEVPAALATTGQGWGLSGPERKAVEMHAMRLARAHYEDKGYQVQDVSGNESYDLLCTNADDELRVEVKGTTGAGKSVFLTTNEVAHARDQYPNVALFVVSGVELRERDVEPTASGGSVRVFEPWAIDDFTLKATQYSCQLP